MQLNQSYPGEELSVYVVKDGKEQNQGVAYLDDGTMIVVEDGRDILVHNLMYLLQVYCKHRQVE